MSVEAFQLSVRLDRPIALAVSALGADGGVESGDEPCGGGAGDGAGQLLVALVMEILAERFPRASYASTAKL